MKKVVVKYLIFIVLLSLLACHQKPKQPVEKAPLDKMKQSMEVANRYLVKDEEQDIAHYIERHGIAMQATGTGLRYAILKQGGQELLQEGDVVGVEYELRSIAGDLFYSSEQEGIKRFRVGDGSVESGLDEAMHHLHYGDVAKVIIPSHLAYGLHGDDRNIPEFSTLIYTIKIIENQ
ncbi:MAG: FKBP-type peptidyl-prolyl cis-trans isomerase [Bacteroidales bacterium]|nr:FKBP-type peptidyl-prolyl cis-trans isomerase [Bacteroidales bacterium]